MPAYQAQPSTQTYPPFTISAISPGIENYSWGLYTPYADAPTLNVEHAENMPANGTAGKQFALYSYAGKQQNSGAIQWETILTGTSACSIVLQGATRDLDAEYFTLDTSTNAAGEARAVTLGTQKVNFLRVKVVSSTNTGGTIIAKFTV
jgi:hypothetical protein